MYGMLKHSALNLIEMQQWFKECGWCNIANVQRFHNWMYAICLQLMCFGNWIEITEVAIIVHISNSEGC